MFKETETQPQLEKDTKRNSKEAIYKAFGFFKEVPVEKFRDKRGEKGGEFKQSLMKYPEWTNKHCALSAKLAMILDMYSSSPRTIGNEIRLSDPHQSKGREFLGIRPLENDVINVDVVTSVDLFDSRNFVENLKPFENWLQEFFENEKIKISYKDKNQNYFIKASIPIDKERNLRDAANLYKFFPHAIKSIKFAADAKQEYIENILIGRWTPSNESDLNELSYLDDFIIEKSLAEVIDCLTDNPDLFDIDRDSIGFKIDLTSDQMNPIISRQRIEEEGIFGPTRTEKILKTYPIGLDRKLSCLTSNKIKLYHTGYDEEDLFIYFEDPLKFKVRLFAKSHHEKFYKELKSWMNKFYGRSNREKDTRQEIPQKNIIKNEKYYLGEFGIIPNEFANLDTNEKIQEIRRCYRKLTPSFHPDKASIDESNNKNPASAKAAEGLMKDLNEAYEYFKKKYNF